MVKVSDGLDGPALAIHLLLQIVQVFMNSS